MAGLFSQIQGLDTTDLADILRNVQCGTLTLQEEQAYPVTQQRHEDDAYVVDDSYEVDARTEPEAEHDFLPDVLSPHRFINLKRPGRRSAPNDLDVDVPHSRNELHKQILAAKRMGAPTEVANRISMKAGLASTSVKVKPNTEHSRSVLRLRRPQEARLDNKDGQRKYYLYTLSHFENDCDVSAYSGGRLLSSHAQLVCFLTRSKRNTGIDA